MSHKNQPWLRTPPARTGHYLWRNSEGSPEYSVQVRTAYSIRGEAGYEWLCYELTDFADMEAGGEWQFKQESPTGDLLPSYVEHLVQSPTAWGTAAPTENGRYLWRESAEGQPYLIFIRTGVALSTNNSERFVTSCGHSSPQEFEALLRTGQWAVVEDNIGINGRTWV